MEETSKTRNILKIGITGPESSGKTWMASQLARMFDDIWLPEYAREYLSARGPQYSEADLSHIAAEQLRREDEYLAEAKRFLFCDTDVVVLNIWYRYKFGFVPQYLEQTLRANTYALHLLMKPDIPYEADELRENPDRGMYFFNAFKNELDLNKLPYVIISGPLEQRIKKAGEQIRLLADRSPA